MLLYYDPERCLTLLMRIIYCLIIIVWDSFYFILCRIATLIMQNVSEIRAEQPDAQLQRCEPCYWLFAAAVNCVSGDAILREGSTAASLRFCQRWFITTGSSWAFRAPALFWTQMECCESWWYESDRWKLRRHAVVDLQDDACMISQRQSPT